MTFLLRQHLRRQRRATSGGRQLDSQKACSDVNDSSRFAGRECGSIDQEIFRIDVGCCSLQDDADRRGRSAKNGLPTHGVPLIWNPGGLGDSKLCACRSVRRKRFGVEAEPNVTGKQGKRRSGVVISGHIASWVGQA